MYIYNNKMSIFDLKTDVSQLASANQQMSKMAYEQHAPTRDVTNNNFSNGAIHVRFQCSGQKWWVPSRSYIRTRLAITKANGTQLDAADRVAPNMGLMSNLFQSAEFRVASKTLSRVSDYMPQIDALETRLNKSKSWVDSVGASTNWWQEDVNLRTAEISSDGLVLKNPQPQNDVVDGRVALGLDVAGAPNRNIAIYTAATGLIDFDANGGAALPVDMRVVYPAGSYFVYTAGTTVAASLGIAMKVITGLNGAPAGSATQIVVERGLVANEAGNPGNAADFNRITVLPDGEASRRISSFETTWQPPLSIFKIDHAMPSGDYELILNPQTSTQFKKRAIESALVDKTPGVDYEVNIVDMYLYVATVDGERADNLTYLLDLQDTRCQVDNVDGGGGFQQKNFDVSPSTYALTTCFQDTQAGTLTQYSASKFKIGGDAELLLNRMFINYAGMNKPQPDADPAFQAALDHTTQRYVDSILNSGGYFDCGGAETIDEYHKRGSYYYFSWPRDGTDRSTRVNVHFGFSGAVANGRVLLFDHSKKVARIQVQDGKVVMAEIEDQ
jgi:hypothetical protein